MYIAYNSSNLFLEVTEKTIIAVIFLYIQNFQGNPNQYAVIRIIYSGLNVRINLPFSDNISSIENTKEHIGNYCDFRRI